MRILENVLLAPYTTFKIGGPARFFCVVSDQFDALEAYEFAKKNNLKTFVLGGGSNLLVSDEGFDGLVLNVANKGIEIANAPESSDVYLKVGSGEVWDDLVKFAVSNGWWGIENLSHIPGLAGAIAVQNVGAYGQEAKSVIESVVVFNRLTGQIQSLSNADCGFSYRGSIFNSSAKGKYIIFHIVLKLQKAGHANTSYRDLREIFGANSPSLTKIREAVIGIRDKKFPFPVAAKMGNAGSFFKNPVLSSAEFGSLKNKVSTIFGQNSSQELEKKMFTDAGQIKVPAAYLIELCGLKSIEFGGAAINENQPLVIINKTGKASAKDVMGLATLVNQTVLAKTGIDLKFEPELVGFS
jgi:UDP-N-acetylmuramate dehydrogenase